MTHLQIAIVTIGCVCFAMAAFKAPEPPWLSYGWIGALILFLYIFIQQLEKQGALR